MASYTLYEQPIYVVGVCFGNHVSFERNLRLLFEHLNIKPTILIVDNHPASATQRIENTNYAYEFSAYLFGLNTLLPSIPSRGLYRFLVLNDTIFNSHSLISVKGYISLILRSLSETTGNSFTGIHSALPPGIYSHTLTSFYLSTFVFGLSVDRATLRILSQFFSRPFSISLIRPFLSLYRSSSYSEWIDKWLFSPGFLTGWHGANPLTPSGKDTINRKKVAIACEFMMPFYLLSNGLVYRPLSQNPFFRFYYLIDRFSGLISKIRKRYLF